MMSKNDKFSEKLECKLYFIETEINDEQLQKIKQFLKVNHIKVNMIKEIIVLND